MEFDRAGTVRVSGSLMTGSPGLFAGGDMVPAERTVTVGVGHGKRAAREIDAWLRGGTYTRPAKHPLAEFPMLNLWFFGDAQAREQPELAPSARVEDFAEVVGALPHRRRSTRPIAACRAGTAASVTAASARVPRTR